MLTPGPAPKADLLGVGFDARGDGRAASLDEVLASVKAVRYSTTVGINALIERVGPRVA